MTRDLRGSIRLRRYRLALRRRCWGPPLPFACPLVAPLREGVPLRPAVPLPPGRNPRKFNPLSRPPAVGLLFHSFSPRACPDAPAEAWRGGAERVGRSRNSAKFFQDQSDARAGRPWWNARPGTRLHRPEYHGEGEQDREDREDGSPDCDDAEALLDPKWADTPPASLTLVQRHCHSGHVTSRAPEYPRSSQPSSAPPGSGPCGAGRAATTPKASRRRASLRRVPLPTGTDV